MQITLEETCLHTWILESIVDKENERVGTRKIQTSLQGVSRDLTTRNRKSPGQNVRCRGRAGSRKENARRGAECKLELGEITIRRMTMMKMTPIRGEIKGIEIREALPLRGEGGPLLRIEEAGVGLVPHQVLLRRTQVRVIVPRVAPAPEVVQTIVSHMSLRVRHTELLFLRLSQR
jgi:hypothetical protein